MRNGFKVYNDNLMCEVILPNDYKVLSEAINSINLINNFKYVTAFKIIICEPFILKNMDTLKNIIDTCKKPVYLELSNEYLNGNNFDNIAFINNEDNIKGIIIRENINGIYMNETINRQYAKELSKINKEVIVYTYIPKRDSITQHHFGFFVQIYGKVKNIKSIEFHKNIDVDNLEGLRVFDYTHTCLLNEFDYSHTKGTLSNNDDIYRDDNNKFDIIYHRYIKPESMMLNGYASAYVSNITIDSDGKLRFNRVYTSPFFIDYIKKNSVTPEIWKDIVGFEKTYQISNKGRIKNKNTGLVLKTRKSNDYMLVDLWNNDKQRKYTKRVHRLLGEAFLPNPNNYRMVTIKDKNVSTTDLNNLEWSNRRN